MVLFLRVGRIEKPNLELVFVSVFSVKPSTNFEHKNTQHQGVARIAERNKRSEVHVENTIDASLITESKQAPEPRFAEQTSTDKVSAEKSEGSGISDKALASLDSLEGRYKLIMPKAEVVDMLTPAQQAAQDVRSNSPKLTKSEKFAQAVGTLDCIFQARLGNGKIIREPGRWVEVQARSEPGMRSLAKVRFCIRFHQALDEDGNDMTEISAGLRGK